MSGVTVRQNQRTSKCFRLATYISLPVVLLVPVWIMYTHWDRMTPVGRKIILAFYSLQLILTIYTALPIRRCLQRILKRKRLLFYPSIIDVSLRTAICNLQDYILSENEAKRIEERASCFLQTIGDHISKGFEGRKIKFFSTSGFAERYGMPLFSEWITVEGVVADNHALISDFNFMFELENISAGFEPSNGDDFVLKTDRCQLGYAELMILNPQTKSLFNCQSSVYLSAKSIKEEIHKLLLETDVSIYPGFKIYIPMCCFPFSWKHFVATKMSDPAIKLNTGKTPVSKDYSEINNNFLADIVFSIHCKEFPRSSDFNSRIGRKWPDRGEVERIANLGCHLVPKSQVDDQNEITWKFSFSQGEVELSKLINDTARQCFLALKIIGKDHLIYTCRRLSSDHLKTIFLGMIETTGLEYWSEDNIEIAFKALLGEVKNALDAKVCQHFWIPEINLFEGIPGKELEAVSRVLDKIIENPSPYIQYEEKVNKPGIFLPDSATGILDFQDLALMISYSNDAADRDEIVTREPRRHTVIVNNLDQEIEPLICHSNDFDANMSSMV